jgi:hypothetical protein
MAPVQDGDPVPYGETPDRTTPSWDRVSMVFEPTRT